MTARGPMPSWPIAARVLAGGCGLGAALLVAGTLAPWLRSWFGLAVAVVIVPGMIRRELAVVEPLAFVLVIGGGAIGAWFGTFSVSRGVLVGLLLLAFVLLVELADELAGSSSTRSAQVAGWIGTVAPLLGAGVLAGLFVGAILMLPLPPVLAVVLVAPLLVLAAAALAFGQRFARS